MSVQKKSLIGNRETMKKAIVASQAPELQKASMLAKASHVGAKASHIGAKASHIGAKASHIGAKASHIGAKSTRYGKMQAL